MSNSLCAAVLAPVLVTAAAALCGCTAGEIVAADGSELTGYNGPSTVTFKNMSTYEEYTVSVSESGNLTFSFDPYAPASATNGPGIPPGKYTLIATLCTDAAHCMPYGNWTGFNVSYDQTCTDTYTGKTVPCAIFKVLRCQFPTDYEKYGSLCTSASVSGGVTTVGVLDGP